MYLFKILIAVMFFLTFGDDVLAKIQTPNYVDQGGEQNLTESGENIVNIINMVAGVLLTIVLSIAAICWMINKKDEAIKIAIGGIGGGVLLGCVGLAFRIFG